MSRADGPERGRKTEGLRSRPVLSPRRREAARREQAKRDKRSTRGRCIRSGPLLFCSSSSGDPPSGPSGHLLRQGEGIGRRAQVPRRVWGAASQTRPGAAPCVGRDDPGAPTPVPFPVILRPEAEGSALSFVPSSPAVLRNSLSRRWRQPPHGGSRGRGRRILRCAQDDKGETLRMTHVSPVILRPEAEGSVPSSAPSSGPSGHLPPSRGEGFGAAPVRFMGPGDRGDQGKARR